MAITSEIIGKLGGGDALLHQRSISGINSLAHIGTGAIEVGLRRSTADGSDSFTGTVYAVKV